MSNQTYIPQPEAARILGRLIEFGYEPNPPPTLPPEWQNAYAAVCDVRTLGRHARSQAFGAAIERLPHAYEMYAEVAHSTPETEDRASQHRILHSAEDALKDPPQLDWCVQELLPQPSLTVIVGDPGSKKTYLAIDLAACVALGKPWLGRPVNQSPVLLIDEESGLLHLWGRLNASLHAHQAGWHTPLHFISLGGYDLRAPKDAEELTHRALSIDARLIVIDALAGVMGGDENSLASVQPALHHLRRMAEYCRAAVVVLHHTNRHGVFRGSSLISAAVDLMLSVESAPDDPLITLRTLKARQLAPLPFCARANFETAPDGRSRFWLSQTDDHPSLPDLGIKPTNVTTTVASALLDFLASSRQATVSEIFTYLDSVAQGTIRNVLQRLMVSGLVTRADGGPQGKKAVYKLSGKVAHIDNE